MPRRPILASLTAFSVALGAALIATPAGAAPPDPRPNPRLTAPSDHTLARLQKLTAVQGATGTITAFVQLAAPSGTDVAAEPGTDEADVKAAARSTRALAASVVPKSLTGANAGTAEPKRIATLTNLVSGTVVTGDAARIRALAASDDVVAIYRVARKTIENAQSVAFTRALESWQGAGGVTGEGVSIGVIDTGLDYTHADFGGPGTVAAYEEAYGEDGTGPIPAGLFDSVKFAGGYDFAGPLYDASGEEPGSSLVPAPDPNPIDALATSPNSGHGTHVAGTAAGYGVDPDGKTFDGDYASLTDVSDWQIGPGTAPEAKLWSFKVFGDIGGSTDITSLALDRAADPNADGDFSDHVDVLNLSLGGDGAPADDPDNLLIDALTALGTVVAISSGNAGDIVDIGGSPGNASSALTVANSIGNPLFDAVEVTDAADPALEGEYAAQNSVNYTGADVTAPVAFVSEDFDGCTPFTPTQAAAVAGKIAYLWWDDDDATRLCGSATRFNNAAAAGAVGVLLPTEQTAFAAGIAGNATIPGAQLTSSATDALLPEIEAGTLTAHIGPGLAARVTAPGVGDLLNPGSSRGVHGSLGIGKPDVAAPGTTIQSAASGTGDLPHALTGTSMAAPHAAGIAALVRSAHPGWDATQVKAAVVNTATHDVYTGLDHTGEVYGPQRVGSGRVDAVQAVGTDVVAYNTQKPAQTSVTFGVVPVGATTVVKKQTVTVKNLGDEPATYATSFTTATTAGGATITASPAGITVPAGGSSVVTLTLTVDPATLARDLDPTSDELQSGVPREYVAEVAGRLVLTSPSYGELRVPVQAAPKPVSELTASGVTFANVTATTGALTLAGRGVDAGGWTSLTSPLILGATSPKLETPTAESDPPSLRASSDIRYVGWSSTAPYVDELGGDPADGTLNIGIAVDGEWASLGRTIFPVIDIDLDKDGEFDLEAIVWKYADSVDLTVVETYDLHAAPTAPPVDVEVINNEFGDVDTGVFDSNVLVAPIGLGYAGIEPGSKPLVQAYTYSAYSGTVVDVAPSFTVDPYTPPFWFETDRSSLVSSNGAAGAVIPVHRSAAATSGKLLVLQHHNANPVARAQVVPVTVPVATTTRLGVSGGTSVGSTATLTATVAPATAVGSVKFTAGTKVLATVPVSKGKAVAKVKLGLGTHSLKATFTPTTPSSFGPSVSSPVSLVVKKSATTTTIKLDSHQRAYVKVVGATSAPDAKVQIKKGTTVLATVTLSVSGLTGTGNVLLHLPPGTHTLTAVYPGGAKTLPSKATVSVTVPR